MKPQLFTSDPSIQNNLKDQEKHISVSLDCLEYNPKAALKVFIQLEPPSIKDLRSALINNHHSFDLILAWHTDILEGCPNSKRFIYGDCWIDIETFKSNKKNQVSFIASDKIISEGHKLRQEVYEFLQSYKADNFSIMNVRTPPRIPTKHPIFEEAKFSIVIENEKCENWITEKLIDCLITKTIPIYWGSPNVGEFFNQDGILCFSDLEHLQKVLSEITPKMYEELLPIIEENYKLAFKYREFFKRVDEEIDLL